MPMAAASADRRLLYRHFQPVSSADFDQNFEPINENYPPTNPSSFSEATGASRRRPG